MWSLDKEIRTATAARDRNEGLRKAGICRDTCRGCQIHTVHDWYPEGAETYIYRFDVHHSDGDISALTLRACVALTGFDGVGTIADQWAERRRLLALCGLKVPATYWVEQGTIAEEHIPYTLAEAWRARTERRSSLTRQLGELCGTLAACRFTPIALSAPRSHGEDVVIVDVGSDLGAPWCDPIDAGHIVRLGTQLLDALDGEADQHHHWFHAGYHDTQRRSSSSPNDANDAAVSTAPTAHRRWARSPRGEAPTVDRQITPYGRISSQPDE